MSGTREVHPAWQAPRPSDLVLRASPLRVLIVGSRHPWRVERGVERALRRAGHRTLLLDDRRLARRVGRRLTQRAARFALRRFRPDFVLLFKCLGLDLDTVAALVHGRDNASWYQDPQWHRDTHRPDIGHIAAVGRLCRTFFVTGFDAEWRALGLPAKFLPAAGAREIVPVPPSPAYASDVAFVGTPYDEERPRFLAEVGRRVRLRVWGPRWDAWAGQIDWAGRPVEGAEFAAVCSSAKITLGVLPARAAGATSYASDRMWMSILAGGFYLGPAAPGVVELLRDGEHCAWYRGVEGCVAQVERYLADAALRDRVRAAGERFVRAHHTFDARVPFLLAGEAWRNPLLAAGEAPR